MTSPARRRSPAAVVVALLLGVAMLLSGARPARADDPDTRAAKKHFQRGEKLFNLGRFEEALAEYEAAYDRKPLPGFLYNIAQCHRNLGDYKQAIFGYRNYLRQVPDASNRDAVLALIDELEQKQHDLDAAAARDRASHPPPPPPPPRRRPRPLYERGWFWGGVAAVTAITVGTLVVTSGDGAPSTDLGNVDFH
ncbi:MAG TPA: tetratricopeptide repeat protein [Kofleriaceae bacterium]|nr:tetratricopeptide repeat protein [Kofleriaceae bacterium]